MYILICIISMYINIYIYIFTYVHTKDPNHQIRFPSRAFCAVAEAICRITATRCLAELTATVAASIASIECPIRPELLVVILYM